MEITKKTLLSTESRIDVVIEHEGVNYRFRVIVNETPKYSHVRDISYPDHYQVQIKNSLKKKFRKQIREHFESAYLE